MVAEQNFNVVKIATEETYALRTAILRANTPTSDPKFAGDSKPGTIHLGIFDQHKKLVATSTWMINPWSNDSSSIAIQLRGMAVDHIHRKSGLGKKLIDAGIAHARSLNAKYIWANARDTALPFYLRNEFVLVGDGFIEEVTKLPHHMVVLNIH